MLRPPLIPIDLVVIACLATGARAQCGQWQPGLGYPGVAGTVHAATMWDSDGPGPLPPRLVLAGDFRFVGQVAARRIAAQDPVTGAWAPLGSGLEYLPGGIGMVNALTALPNGDLIAGGFFSHAGGVAANSVARWDGIAWSPLGNGITGPNGGPAEVDQLTTLANGDVVVAGRFTLAGGTPARNVARWNGVAWSTMGGGIPLLHLGQVRGLGAMPNGDVVAAGEISGGVVTRWNGTSWQPIATDVTVPYALAALPNGDFVIGHDGFFGLGGVSRWNGTSWSSLGNFNGSVRMLEQLANGDLLAGGKGTAGCTLWVTPDVLLAYVPSGGSVTTTHSISDNPSLIGFVFHQQVMALELDPNGIIALTGTNALTITEGAF